MNMYCLIYGDVNIEDKVTWLQTAATQSLGRETGRGSE